MRTIRIGRAGLKGGLDETGSHLRRDDGWV